jgi:hypothetical protein
VSEAEFERRLSAALRSDVHMDARARTRIMERVREVAHDRPPVRAPFRGRGIRHSFVGLALAASVGSVTTLSALLPRHVGADAGAARSVMADSLTATLRDTLRLVRLMFDAPGATRVAVVGDFNGWRADSTPLARSGTNRWTATLALHDGSHRYAFVVDGTRWVPDPTAERVRADDGRVYSLLHVSRAIN